MVRPVAISQPGQCLAHLASVALLMVNELGCVPDRRTIAFVRKVALLPSPPRSCGGEGRGWGTMFANYRDPPKDRLSRHCRCRPRPPTPRSSEARSGGGE